MGNSPGAMIDPNGEVFRKEMHSYDAGEADRILENERLMASRQYKGSNNMFGIRYNDMLMSHGGGGGGGGGMSGGINSIANCIKGGWGSSSRAFTYSFSGDLSKYYSQLQPNWCFYAVMQVVSGNFGDEKGQHYFRDAYADMKDGETKIGEELADQGINVTHIPDYLTEVGASSRKISPAQYMKHGNEELLGKRLGQAIAQGHCVIISENINENLDHALLLTKITISNGVISNMEVWNPDGAKRGEIFDPKTMTKERQFIPIFMITNFESVNKKKLKK
jgi:hypothetical protein